VDQDRLSECLLGDVGAVTRTGASSVHCGEDALGRLQVALRARARLRASVGSAYTLRRPYTGGQSSEARISNPKISPLIVVLSGFAVHRMRVRRRRPGADLRADFFTPHFHGAPRHGPKTAPHFGR
jgi:hypothetical protein